MKTEIELWMNNVNCCIVEIQKDVFRITLIDDKNIAEILDLKHQFETHFQYRCDLVQYDTLEVRND